jgi:hypothetical protein
MAKIINPSKLLASSKSSAITKIGKSNILAKTSPLSKGLLATRQSKDVTDANNKLVKVDKFLKSDLIVSQKKAEVKRKKKETQDFDEAEKKLETPQSKKFKLPGFNLPSLGFMDRVKRFLFFTALGWLVPKIIEFLPKLEGFAKIVGGIYQFAEGMFGKLFDGFMSLVKFGGDLKDKTLGFIASAKAGVGGNYDKEFKKLENQFNTFVNASIIAGVLAADIGSAAVDEYNKWKKKSESTRGVTGGKLAGKVGLRDVGRELGKRKPGYQDSSRYRAKGQARAGGFALEQARKKAPTLKSASWWEKLTGGLKSKFAGVAGKLAKPFQKFAGAAIPGLGAALGAADAKARFKSGDKLGGFLASLSASLDAFTAAVAIAGLASAATGVGLPAAAVLATAATAAGAISMSIDVILLIRDILKAFGVPVFNKGGRVVKRYQGGGTTRGGRPVGGPKRRAITPTRRKPQRVTLPKTQPGKDVGGEKKVKEFYAKPEDPSKKYTRPAGGWLANLGQERQDLSAFDTLKKMSGTLKSDETLAKGILGVMSSGIDMALGQKPDKKVFKAFFDSIGYIADTLANQRTSKSMSSLRSQIGAFAEGGTVPSRGLRGTYIDANTGDMLAKLIGPTIDQRVNEAIQSIEKQLQMKGAGGKKEPPQDLDMTPGNIRVTSDSPDFWLLVSAALFENGIYTDGYQGAADVAQAIYNRVALPGWPKSIRGVILQPGQFSPVGSYGGVEEWSKINSRESAIAFAKKYKGYSGNIVDRVAATLLDKLKQEKARTFVGPRDNFRNYASEAEKNNLDDSTEARRYGHVFGFEPRGANIGRFKKGTLMPAEINKEIVSGKVEETVGVDSGYVKSERGTKLSGDLGDFMKSWGGVPGSIWQHSRHGGQGKRNYSSYHNVDRAIDLGANANEQGPILKKIEEFNRLKGVKPVQILHAGNDPKGGHNDHVHVAYQGGGLIGQSKPNRHIPNSFASYETPGGGMMIAIQPMIIEKQVPVSGGGGKMIAFPVPVAVNSSIDLSLSRG